MLERVLERVVGEKVSAEDDLARSQGEVLALGARIEDLATRATRRRTGSEVGAGENSPSFVSEQLTGWSQAGGTVAVRMAKAGTGGEPGEDWGGEAALMVESEGGELRVYVVIGLH